jgi:outer membrane lipoprotein carrier protein
MSFKKSFLITSVAVFSLVQSNNVLANAAEALKEKLANLNSFEAVFVQQVKDEQGNLIQEGQGEIALAHPLKIRWQQLSPDSTLLISDSAKAYYYDDFAEQVTIMDVHKLIDTTPFVLLTTRSEQQWAKYSVEASNNGYLISPNPDTESQVESLYIRFDKSSLSHIEVLDLSGQKSHFSFSERKVNKEINPQTFTFTLPEGVMVDDQTTGE